MNFAPCYVNKLTRKLTTFLLTASKGNIFEAYNFTGVMRKIQAFLWYQNLGFDGEKWGMRLWIGSPTFKMEKST